MLRSFALLALCVGCPSPSDAPTDETDTHVHDEDTDTDPPQVLAKVSGQVRDADGQPVEGIVLACADVCIPGRSDASGAIALDGQLWAGDWWMQVVMVDNPDWMPISWPIEVASGQESVALDFVLAPRPEGTRVGTSPQDYELSPGVTVRLQASHFPDDREPIANAVPLDLTTLPQELLPHGTPVAAWSVDPHRTKIEGGTPFSITPTWEPSGGSLTVYGVGYGWDSLAEGSDDGSVLTGELTLVSVLLVMREEG